jgi:hypothetical protein
MARSFVNLYVSAPELVCYDGEPANPPVDPPVDPPKTFTQADLDKALAADKRTHQAQYTKLEKQLQDTLATAKLSTDERAKMEESLEDVRKQLRSKEEQAKLDKKKLEDEYTGKLTAAEQRAAAAEKRWQDSAIERSLRDAAAAEDAFNPDILVTVLRSQTKLVDDKPTVEFETVNDKGEAVTLMLTPLEAIKKLKEDAARFGNLFKSGVVGGIGGTGSAGTLPKGKVDVKNLSMEQYMKLRKENPAALGLA